MYGGMRPSGLARRVEETRGLVDRAYEEWSHASGQDRSAAYLRIRNAERARDEAMRALLLLHVPLPHVGPVQRSRKPKRL